MKVVLRQAFREDIPGMHAVRRAVRENKLISDAIREEHYVPAIESTGRGWIIEEDETVVAFAVGNAETGNIWALFVHLEHEGKGYGKKLQDTMIRWLFDKGLTRVYLSTAPGTRAQSFYEATGWKFTGIDSRGEATYERDAPVDS